MWYCTSELALRQGLFFSAASMAGAFSGLLAYAIAQMDGVGGYAGWRWIFILEGLLTVVVAVAAFFLLYDFPDTAKFLTTEEKAWVVRRLKYQGSKKSGRNIAESDHFQWKFVRKGKLSHLVTQPAILTSTIALTDWQLWMSMFMGELTVLIITRIAFANMKQYVMNPRSCDSEMCGLSLFWCLATDILFLEIT